MDKILNFLERRVGLEILGYLIVIYELFYFTAKKVRDYFKWFLYGNWENLAPSEHSIIDAMISAIIGVIVFSFVKSLMPKLTFTKCDSCGHFMMKDDYDLYCANPNCKEYDETTKNNKGGNIK